MRNIVKGPEEKPEIRAGDMKMGQIGKVIGSDAGWVGWLMRTYQGLVSLDNPSNTWVFNVADGYRPSFRVRLLQPGETITITPEGER